MRSKSLFCLVLAGVASAQNQSSFQVTSGDNVNFFLRDNTTTAQLLLTKSSSSSELSRLVVALPAGNSGALTYFIPAIANNTDEQFAVTLQNGTLTSTTDDFDNVGVQADLRFSGNATMGVTIIGAVRAMRDYVEGGGTMNEIFNYTLADSNETSVKLHRQWINATSSGAFKAADLVLNTISGVRFNVTPSCNGSYTPPTVDIIVDEGGGTVQLRFVTNETTIAGLSPEDLFLSNGTSSGVNIAIQGLANGTNVDAQQVSFLTFKEKFTAGGWRFLTYFGRDSMIALRLLMPILTSDAIEAALGAVIERVNSTGALCHEETIGDYSSFVNIGNNQSELGNQPFYDYKMIDTDLFLLPTLAHYFLDLPQGRNRSAAFLSRVATLQIGTYGELINKTVNYNLGRAMPFSLDPQVASLLAFRPGQPVGNWRDSNQGTGYGPIPFDVNVALVPASLRATARLARAGILFNTSAATPVRSSALADVADATAQVWEDKAPGFFEVTLNASATESRLLNFVQQANLSQTLLGNSTSAVNDTASVNKTFFALSLMEDGSPVEVLHSDLGFNLLYGNNVTESFLQRVLEALVSYPRGLLTNIGMVVANPAYDSNTTNIDVLNRGAYHGTVIWSWQQGLMAAGLERQLGFCSNTSNTTVDVNPAPAEPPIWCANATFVQSMVDARSRLWASIKGGVNELFSEVWTYDFDNSTNTFSVGDLASISPDGTESDAIQLWSYGFLGLLDPEGLRVGR